jgi:CheY-like chemotaxis protein
MNPSIYTRCPGCNARIKAPFQLVGQTRSCPGCGQRLLIPAKVPEDSSSLLFVDDSAALLQLASIGKQEDKLILLADDDRELNDGLRSLLEKHGHHVVQAFDGVQAKQLAKRLRPDLVVLDMMMPRMGGYPVLEYFHDKPDAPPIIIITAREGSQHKVYAEHMGVVDYLNKPFAIDRFLESVKNSLGCN